MDDVDRAAPDIQATVDDGIAQARRALGNPRLAPIVLELDGIRFGVCHYCETEIKPGRLFCDTDPIEPAQSCAVMWEYTRRRTGVNG